MNVLKTLWGLLVDDGRLASILVVGILLAAISAVLHHHTIAAGILWLSLMVSLWVSVSHQLRLKTKK